MYLFHVLCVILFVTSVLTLATKKEKKLDRELENTNNSTSKTGDNVLKESGKNGKFSAKKNLSTEKIDQSIVSILSIL